MHIFMKKQKEKTYQNLKYIFIMDMREHLPTFCETVRKYWNTKNRSHEDLYLKNSKRRERIFIEEGAEAP